MFKTGKLGISIMQYRRDYTQGASYFFTVVTFRRVGFFNTDEAVNRLRSAFKQEMARRPFVIRNAAK